MPRKRKVTLRAQWLGKLLKELRQENEMTLKEVGEHIRRDFSTLSRIEAGIQPIPQPELVALMDLYGVEGQHQRDALLQLGAEQTKTGWWDRYARDTADWFIDYVWLENRARSIHAFDSTPINGLLQTPEYAEALMRAVNPTDSASQIERGVELRMTRQRILEGDEPTELHVVMDEAVLRRIVGGRSVMRAQLRHLLERVEHPHIQVRVIPHDHGVLASFEGGFRLLRLDDPFPLVGYLECPAGGLYLESSDAEQLAARYDRLRSVSLSPGESVDLVESIERELR
ncbi:helix-turn-helix domain-containing protein [Nocardiopsis sp. EMB25]|uniref:helix-turn-helix domain-containing protein n=1 Tax=Nocardiopsis sp. EMB25 TaxID=2835867 RepID=UPI0022839801|nr:helix-turn-helix transcriptional regulator [Nocardiopsis sp. EMB25]MCY9784109.1 helix-turn-helix domain-containing protein [Nocardiopsis sp. EMB25]